jgi:hypothetical protein
MTRALNRHVERVFNPDQKDSIQTQAKEGRVIGWRGKQNVV